MPRRAMATAILDNKTARKTKAEIAGRKEVENAMQKIPSTLICPQDLDGKAKQVWADVVRLCQTSDYNFLNDLDADLLRCYCESVERYEIAARTWRKKLKKQILGKNQETQREIDKCILEMSRAGEEMQKYARSLNITSAERERLAVASAKAAKKNSSTIARFMNDDP